MASVTCGAGLHDGDDVERMAQVRTLVSDCSGPPHVVQVPATRGDGDSATCAPIDLPVLLSTALSHPLTRMHLRGHGAAERIRRAEPRVRDRLRVAEEERVRLVVVVAVVPLDHFVAQVVSELPGVDPEAAARPARCS